MGMKKYGQNIYTFILIEYLGKHYRISSDNINSVVQKLPNWLYWFDMWTCRLDASGDSNLLCIGDRIVPVDFGLCFCWANFHYHVKINEMKISHHKKIIDIADENIKNVIKNLTDDEIYNIIMGNKDILQFIDNNLLAAYYTGLIMRRDLL